MPDEEKPPPKIALFPVARAANPPAEPLVYPPGKKFGLYPVGREDVIMSVELVSTILMLLEQGTLEQRRALSAQMRYNLGAYFVE